MMLQCVVSFPWLEMSTGEGHHRHQAWAMSSRGAGERLRQVGQPPGVSPNHGSHGHLPILTPQYPCGLAPVSMVGHTVLHVAASCLLLTDRILGSTRPLPRTLCMLVGWYSKADDCCAHESGVPSSSQESSVTYMVAHEV